MKLWDIIRSMMLFSLALIFLLGMALGKISDILHLPNLVGMLITGIILGPYVLNLLDANLLAISTDLRQIALIIILTRAGLNLDIKDLKKVGRPAILMCFVPAIFEIAAVTFLAPMVFDISYLDAAIMGAVLAAVSPAIIVPRMIKLMESGYGQNKSIPQMVMAGATVDDVFVIVLFTAFLGFSRTGSYDFLSLLAIPSAIVLGIGAGFVIGLAFAYLFKRYHLRDSGKVVIILSISFLLVSLEHSLEGILGFSGLLAVMTMGITLQQNLYVASKRLSGKFSKLWVGAEILLFVLVGATVDVSLAFEKGAVALLLIMAALLFRVIGVLLSVYKTKLNVKERVFVSFAYVPKATVQAAIGGIPLALGIASGHLILTVAVISILISAPLGAWLIDNSYKKLLTHHH